MTVAPVRWAMANGVADVVAVAVRDQDEVGHQFVGLARRGRVAGQERINQYRLTSSDDL